MKIVHQGRDYEMVDLAKPLNCSYMTLTSLNKEKSAIRSVHILIPENEGATFKIGRGHEAEVRIPDISVSRLHANVRFSTKDGGFLLSDNRSKFGTLVLRQGIVKVKEDGLFQIGRTLIELEVHNPKQSEHSHCRPEFAKLEEVMPPEKDTEGEGAENSNVLPTMPN